MPHPISRFGLLLGGLALMLIALALVKNTPPTPPPLPTHDFAWRVTPPYPPLPTLTPRPPLTPDEQAAVESALSYLGKWASSVRFHSLISGSGDTKYRIWFEQVYQGVWVPDNMAIIALAKDGTLAYEQNTLANISLPSAMPAISLGQAAQIAAEQANFQGNYFIDPEHKTQLIVASTSATIDTHKVYALAWMFTLTQKPCSLDRWFYIINASDGSVLKEDWSGLEKPPRRCSGTPRP